MTSTAEQLSIIRQKIDAVDQQLQELINQRAGYALEVAKIKQQDKKAVYYRPEREAQILRSIMQRNQGPLPAKEMAEIFLFIMAKCRSLQHPLKIAFLGPRKSFSHIAAIKHFGAAIVSKPTASIKQIFRDAVTKKIHYGVVPIENSREGIIRETLDALTEFPLKICGEIELSLSDKKIKNNPNTRFLIIGNDAAAPSSDDKTSLLISITNKPGSLAKIFQPFANHNINITFFEPRPFRHQTWSYVFFVDIEGHQQDKIVQEALAELSKQPLNYTILGSYPKAVL